MIELRYFILFFVILKNCFQQIEFIRKVRKNNSTRNPEFGHAQGEIIKKP
jgi:hypothetical protein